MAMLRVIHSAPVWLPRTQGWMYHQVRALPAHVEPHVVCERKENLDAFGVAHLHCLSDTPVRCALDRAVRFLRIRPWLGNLPRVARATRAAVVHSHFGHIGAIDARAVERLGIAHVVTFYGQDVSLPGRDPRWGARYRAMFARVRAVLCEGPHMAQRVVGLGCPADRVHVHALGVPAAELAFRPRRRAPGEPLRVLIAGSFTEKKGIPDALAAVAALGASVPALVTVIGDAGADPRHRREKQRILDVLARTGLAARCRLLGYQPQRVLLEEAYRHHVFLAPSVHAADGDSEGGAPVTILEMAATGMPIVSTTHCDIPHVIRHGESGLLAEEHDVVGLAAHLRHLAEHPEQWGAMAAAARARIEACFDLEQQGRALAAIYARAAGGSAPDGVTDAASPSSPATPPSPSPRTPAFARSE